MSALSDQGTAALAGKPEQRVTLDDPAADADGAPWKTEDPYFDPATGLVAKSAALAHLSSADRALYLVAVDYEDYRAEVTYGYKNQPRGICAHHWRKQLVPARYLHDANRERRRHSCFIKGHNSMRPRGSEPVPAAAGAAGRNDMRHVRSKLCLAALLTGMCAAPAVPQRKQAESACVLRVLNRMTFGPRPGEVAMVERVGLKHWLDAQLHPENIADDALTARLTALPAVTLSQADLMERFPSRQRLRAIENKGAALPGDPVEHAVYADALQAQADAKARKSAKNDDAAQDVFAKPVEFAHADADALLAMPAEARFQHILAMPPEQFAAFRASLKSADFARSADGMSVAQRETLAALSGPQKVVEDELLGSRLLRDVYSQREIEAVMTDFWLNHFNVYLRKNAEMPYLLTSYERDAVRPHALGKFVDLLTAVAESPAMLEYLDNAQSVGLDSPAAGRKQKGSKAGLNENYARELLELHTLGARCEASAAHPASALPRECTGGYTQRDVTEVAEALTGWTTVKPNHGAAFRFEPRRHEPGPKQVLGQTISESGQAEGLALLRELANSPATAYYISQKLAVRFVSDDPPPALVVRMAATWAKTGGDIAAVLRTMLASKEFITAPAKLKTPEEFWLSALRASDADVTNAPAAAQALTRLGMGFYGAQQPNGYAWAAAPWASSGDLLDRFNLAVVFSAGRFTGAVPIWPASDAQAEERSLEGLLLGSPASDRTRAAVLAGAQTPTPPSPAGGNGVRKAALLLGTQRAPASISTNPATARVAGLLLGSPEFQRR